MIEYIVNEVRGFLEKIHKKSMCSQQHKREVADSRMAGFFIRDTACFHCDSMTCESQWKHAEPHMKMPAVQESTTSLMNCINSPIQQFCY